jgi:hypothetical protein
MSAIATSPTTECCRISPFRCASISADDSTTGIIVKKDDHSEPAGDQTYGGGDGVTIVCVACICLPGDLSEDCIGGVYEFHGLVNGRDEQQYASPSVRSSPQS